MKIQIAVVVNSCGKYNAFGWNDRRNNVDLNECFLSCEDGLEPPSMEKKYVEKKYVVEVDIEIPQIEIIKGTVKEKKNDS